MSDDATIIIRLPPELKVLYQTLCRTRGVTIGDELRGFMIGEIDKATKPQIDARKMPKDKKVRKPQKPAKTPQQTNLAFSESFARTIGSNMTKKKINNKK